jgi:hypothetical protein
VKRYSRKMFGLHQSLICFLCLDSISFQMEILLSAVIEDQAHLAFLQVRFGQRACPYLCQSCACACRKAQAMAALALQTATGQALLRCAEAFFERDILRIEAFHRDSPPSSMKQKPLDTHGALHVNLMLQRTCCWEPYVGQTAEAARMAGAAVHVAKDISEEDALRARGVAAMGWYVYKGQDAVTNDIELDAHAPKSLFTEFMKCNPSSKSSFFTPFIDIFLLTLPDSKSVHDEALRHLETHWDTFYGVSMVVNALLGTELPTVPRSKPKTGTFGFWASFLFFSPWGKAVMALRSDLEPSQLMKPVVQLQRCFYKMCELRKGSNLFRHSWRDDCLVLEVRKQLVSELLQTHKAAWPIFRKQVDEEGMGGDVTLNLWVRFVLDRLETVASLEEPGQTNAIPALAATRSRAKPKTGKKLPTKAHATKQRTQLAREARSESARLLRQVSGISHPNCPRCKSNLFVRSNGGVATVRKYVCTKCKAREKKCGDSKTKEKEKEKKRSPFRFSVRS